MTEPFEVDGFNLTKGARGIIEYIEDDGAWGVAFTFEGDDSDDDEAETLLVPAELTDNLAVVGGFVADEASEEQEIGDFIEGDQITVR